jgi:hypothetical protein
MREPATKRAAVHWRQAMAALPLLWATAVPAQAQVPAYVGKVCLISTITTRQSGPVTPQVVPVLLDVTNLGANTYSVVGAATATGGQPFVVGGTATMIGGELFFNMTTTQTHADGWMDTGLNQTRLNVATMQGTFYEIGHDFNTANGQFDVSRYTAGTVSLSMSACQ